MRLIVCLFVCLLSFYSKVGLRVQNVSVEQEKGADWLGLIYFLQQKFYTHTYRSILHNKQIYKDRVAVKIYKRVLQLLR